MTVSLVFYYCAAFLSIKLICTSGVHFGSHFLALSHSDIAGVTNRDSVLPQAVDGNQDIIGHVKLHTRRNACWVQRVSHLEDTLKFYEENFGFAVVRHVETANSSGSDGNCNSAFSKTTIRSEGSDPKHDFCIELVYDYEVNRYQRGNDMRGLVFRTSAFKGDLDLLEVDLFGQRFLETPDGHWIILVDGEVLEAGPTTTEGITGSIEFVSLYVANLTSSILYYENVLGATVMPDADGYSALCAWNAQAKNCADDKMLSDAVMIELVQLPPDESVDFRATQGLLRIVTDETELRRLKLCKKETESHISDCYFSVGGLHSDEEGLCMTDEDGHQYHFIEARGAEDRVESHQEGRTKTVDWAFRKAVSQRIFSQTANIFGEHVSILDASSYDAAVPLSDSDVIINFHAPWCSFCVQNHPLYAELARRVQGPKILFASIDGSRIPVSTVHNEVLLNMLKWTKSEGYPSLFFLPNGDKTRPVEFLGEWTMKSLLDWIQNHTTQTLDLTLVDSTELFDHGI